MTEEFTKVAEASEIPPGKMKDVKFMGQDLMLANVDGKFYALSNICTHMAGPLARGKLTGFVVQCPWHGSRFDVRTGEVVGPPARFPQARFEVKLDNGSVLVKKS
ncbi:MAG: Rieske (2Fe-2S) protein [Nitrososphaerales archaeon]